jgi:hypothetical protein
MDNMSSTNGRQNASQLWTKFFTLITYM